MVDLVAVAAIGFVANAVTMLVMFRISVRQQSAPTKEKK